jgi:hypothetical protein
MVVCSVTDAVPNGDPLIAPASDADNSTISSLKQSIAERDVKIDDLTAKCTIRSLITFQIIDIFTVLRVTCQVLLWSATLRMHKRTLTVCIQVSSLKPND